MTVFEKEYKKKYPKDIGMKDWTEWYAEGHFDYIFNGGPCDDEDDGVKAMFLYKIIKKNLKEALASKIVYIKTFAQLLDANKELKVKKHRFEIGSIVGVCSDCMAEFEITGYEKGGYKAKCKKINSSTSKLKLNEDYFVKDNQIVLKLR